MTEEVKANGLDPNPPQNIIEPGDRFILFVFKPQGIVVKCLKPSEMELGHVAKMCEKWSRSNVDRMPSPIERPRSPIVAPFAQGPQ